MGGTGFARLAVAEIIGESEILGAVNAAMNFEPGAELASNVLTLIKPRRAMQKCHDIYTSSTDREERQLAVALLSRTSDHWVLNFLEQYLDDGDELIQAWGAKLLLELAFADELDEQELQEWVEKCEQHSNPKVRETAAILGKEMEDWYVD